MTVTSINPSPASPKTYGGAKEAHSFNALQADLEQTLPKRARCGCWISALWAGPYVFVAGQQGHDVTLAEPTHPCLKALASAFAEAGQTGTFIQAPWQELLGQLTEPYDLVLVSRRTGMAGLNPTRSRLFCTN